MFTQRFDFKKIPLETFEIFGVASRKIRWVLEQMNMLEDLDGKQAMQKDEKRRRLIEAFNFVHKSKVAE